MDNLSLTTNDGWTYDFEEDLVLTPSPRTLKADWSQLPNDIYHIILKFYYESQGDYWSEITAQKNKYIPRINPSYEEKRIIEYHLNKRKIIGMISRINFFTNIGGVENPSVLYIKNLLNHYYEPINIKVHKNNKKSLKNKKQRCSLCGRLGHNKNNSKYH